MAFLQDPIAQGIQGITKGFSQGYSMAQQQQDRVRQEKLDKQNQAVMAQQMELMNMKIAEMDMSMGKQAIINLGEDAYTNNDPSALNKTIKDNSFLNQKFGGGTFQQFDPTNLSADQRTAITNAMKLQGVLDETTAVNLEQEASKYLIKQSPEGLVALPKDAVYHPYLSYKRLTEAQIRGAEADVKLKEAKVAAIPAETALAAKKLEAEAAKTTEAQYDTLIKQGKAQEVQYDTLIKQGRAQEVIYKKQLDTGEVAVVAKKLYDNMVTGDTTLSDAAAFENKYRDPDYDYKGKEAEASDSIKVVTKGTKILDMYKDPVQAKDITAKAKDLFTSVGELLSETDIATAKPEDKANKIVTRLDELAYRDKTSAAVKDFILSYINETQGGRISNEDYTNMLNLFKQGTLGSEASTKAIVEYFTSGSIDNIKNIAKDMTQHNHTKKAYNLLQNVKTLDTLGKPTRTGGSASEPAYTQPVPGAKKQR